MNFKSGLLLLVVLCFQIGIRAGVPDKAELQHAHKAFPDADAVFLKRNTHTVIEQSKDGLTVHNDVEEEIYFPTAQSDLYRKYAVYHSYFVDVNDLKASTFSYSDGKYKELKVEHFTTEDNVSANVFYDDLKEVNFVFPGVTQGSIGRVNYVEKLNDVHFISPFYFVSYMPVLSSEYTITCPANVHLNYRVFNNDSNKVAFTREEKGRQVTFRWIAKDMNNYKHEDGAPAFAYYAPHVIVTISDYTEAGSDKKVIPDLDGLCQWYKSFIEGINKEDDSLLKATVVSLTKGVTNDEERVRKIYYWVQDNINYVAFEDGMNGFVPREASDICKKRYGDCKDMSSILVKMLRMAGIKAYHTWIGTRSLPYKYSDMASPNIDNHMICIADVGNKRYVLDGTGKYTPLGYVTQFIQGKEALIMKEDGNCEIYNIPILPKEKSTETDTITVNFDANKQIRGGIETSLTGYYKISQNYVYHYSLPEKREEKFSNYLKVGNNKCKISDLSYQGFGSNDSTVKIAGQFELPEYMKSVGNKIYVNPSLEKDDQFDNIDLADRTLPLEVEYKGIKQSTTIINLPAGYKLDYKPEDVSYKGRHASFAINYKVDNDRIIQNKVIETDFLTLPVSELPDWNKMIVEMSKAYKEDIVLIKK